MGTPAHHAPNRAEVPVLRVVAAARGAKIACLLLAFFRVLIGLSSQMLPAFEGIPSGESAGKVGAETTFGAR
jgi:hypothetical protein